MIINIKYILFNLSCSETPSGTLGTFPAPLRNNSRVLSYFSDDFDDLRIYP